MKIFRFNGELWFADDRPLLRRVRRWLAEFGLRERKDGSVDLFGDGSITPLSFFGHRLTFYGHWGQMRTPWGWLVVVMKRDGKGKVTREVERAFLSGNGTPGHAHIWLVGTPHEIVQHVEKRAVA